MSAIYSPRHRNIINRREKAPRDHLPVVEIMSRVLQSRQAINIRRPLLRDLVFYPRALEQ